MNSYTNTFPELPVSCANSIVVSPQQPPQSMTVSPDFTSIFGLLSMMQLYWFKKEEFNAPRSVKNIEVLIFFLIHVLKYNNLSLQLEGIELL